MPEETKTLRTVDEAYGHETITLVTDTDQALAVVAGLAARARVAIDTETVRQPKIDPMTAQMVVMSISADDGPGTPVSTWVLDVRGMDRLALGQAFRAAGTGKPHGRLAVYGWNAGFDDPVTSMNLTTCTAQTFRSLLFWEDLMLYEACLRLGATGNSWYSGLADAAKRKLGVKLEGKGTVQLSYTAEGELTQEQIRYAGYDSRVTLELATVLTAQVADADLTDIVAAAIGSRPVWAGMAIHGIEFDSQDWSRFVDASDQEATALLTRIAGLTGGGQPSLFSDTVAPAYNVGSDMEVKRMLNEHARDQVMAYTAMKDGQARLLGPVDSIAKEQLSLIGGELAEAVSEWRKKSKIRTSFGDNILALVGADGRLHPEFTQCLIDTGRSSSRNPNLQAITPHAKPRMRPTHRVDPVTGRRIARVYVQGDYSQAELRGLAQMADEKVFKDAFTAGRDLHEATAEQMFGVDMHALRDADPKKYKAYRSLAKPLNFGIAYGMREGKLSETLTVGGTPTSREEAKGLLEAWHGAMTGAAAWLTERDRAIDELAGNLPACDFEATWRLHLLWSKVDRTSRDRALRARLGRRPEADEVAEILSPRESVARELADRLGREATESEVDAEAAARLRAVEWAMGFIGSTVLLADGTPFSFESRTLGGRRRLFQVSTESWVMSMAMIAATSRKPEAAAVRARFESESGATLSEESGRGRSPLKRVALAKVFEDKDLRLKYVSHVLQAMPTAAGYLMNAALADCVKGLGNAYRNAPIQGMVADAVDVCFSTLWPRLEAETSHAHVILSVHDSIVVECDLAEAEAVHRILTEEMVAALERFCPDVPVKADVDIQASAYGEDLVDPADIPGLLASWEAGQAESVQDLTRPAGQGVPAAA